MTMPNFRAILAAAIAAVATSATLPASASTFTITSSTSGTNTTFTIRRSGEGTNSAETVRYRAVSRSALAGLHFIDRSGNGTLSFGAGQTTRQIQITERTAAQINDARFTYYQSGGATGSSRKYVFEVVDDGGFILASAGRTISYDSSKSVSSSAFDANSLSVSSGEITVTDQGFTQAYHAVPLDSYFSTLPREYLSAAGARLCVTVNFQAAEVSDGYQYIQIVTNTTTACDNANSADDGNPGTPSISPYLAGFEHKHKGTDANYKKYSFPVTSAGDNCGAVSTPWSDLGNDIGNLCQQRFKSGARASDGRIAVLPSISSLGIRFDASGSDNDDWTVKSVVAKVQAVMPSPVFAANPVVSAAPSSKGSTVTVSLPFNQIMTVSGTPVLSTTWGDLSYVAGSGANVLTFTGSITAAAGTQLKITGLSGGTVTGFGGDAFTWPGLQSISFPRTVDALPTPSIEGSVYLLYTPAHLRWFADRVASYPQTSAALAADIELSNSGSFSAMGGASGFMGTFDGRGHAIAGIKVDSPDSSGASPARYGLFGLVAAQGVVTNLVLTNTTVSASGNPALVGAVCGRNLGTIALCSVFGGQLSTAPRYADGAGSALGGVCGENAGSVRACRVVGPLGSTGSVLFNRVKNDAVGGIAAVNAASGTLQSCYFHAGFDDVTNVNITRGAICGSNAGTIRRCAGIHHNNYYFNGAVGSDAGTVEDTTFPAADAFSSGEVCYALNAGVTDGTQTWYQKIDGSNRDPLPVFAGPTVYPHGTKYCNEFVHNWSKTFEISPDYSNIVWTVTCSYGETDTLAATGTCVVMPEPTCTNAGTTTWTYVPPANDYGVVTKSEVLAGVPAALGHDWGEPSCSWSEDSTSVTATFSCTRCDEQVVETTNATCVATVPSTCTVPGMNTFVATFASPIFTEQTNVVVLAALGHDWVAGTPVPPTCTEQGYTPYTCSRCSLSDERDHVHALGHSWGEPTYVWSADNSTVTATHACTRENCNAIENETVGATSQVTAESTCTTAEITTYTATFVTLGFSTQTKTVETAPALGHDWAGPVWSWNDGYTAASAAFACSRCGTNETVVAAVDRVPGDGDSTVCTATAAHHDQTFTDTVTIRPPVPYIDADGVERQCCFYTILTNSTGVVEYGAEGATNWYVVASDVTIGGRLQFKDNYAHLVICDGATLAVDNADDGLYAVTADHGLAVYGQSAGTGALTVTGPVGGIFVRDQGFTFNGGNLTVTTKVYGFYCGIGGVIVNRGVVSIVVGIDARAPEYSFGIFSESGQIVVNGGNVSITSDIYGIHGSSVAINGGTVSAVSIDGEGCGISASLDISLGWSDPADSITSSSYNSSRGSVSVKGGQLLTDGTAVYHGVVDPADLAGKTLRPYFVPYIDADGDAQICTNYTAITSAVDSVSYGAGGATNWYVVVGNVAIDGELYFGDYAHLILADGATLAVTNANGNVIGGPGITIYGQANGTGAIAANGNSGINTSGVTINGGSIEVAVSDNGIGSPYVTINGGSVTATGGDYGISCGILTINVGNVTAAGRSSGISVTTLIINGGSIAATATANNGCGIAGGNLTINDGNVTASGLGYGISFGVVTINGGNVIATATGNGGYGIYGGDISIGWTDTADSITASSYGVRSIIVKAGQTFTDGAAAYSGTISGTTQLAALAGKTLRPAFAITYNLAGGSLATDHPVFYTPESADITLVNPTRAGYDFTGWTGTGLDAPALTVVIAQGSSGDRAYVANWTPDLATYWHADADHDGTSASRAYVITTSIGLDLLAELVGENDGKYFVLGWTDSADRIAVGDYGDNYFDAVNIAVAPGQCLTDGVNVYGGEITGEQMSALAGNTLRPVVPYIDANGDTQYCADFTVLTNAAGVAYGDADAEAWYVAALDVVVAGQLRFKDSRAHVVLVDGATLAVTNSASNGNAVNADGDLVIYRQTLGTGALSVYGGKNGVNGGNVTIVGGCVTATGGKNGINGSNITIVGGDVGAAGENYGIYATYTNAVVGGNVSAIATNGTGIFANSWVVLGWTDPADSITASSYGSYLGFSVKERKKLTDGIEVYSGELDSAQIAAIAGATLRPSLPPPLAYVDADGVERLCYDYVPLESGSGGVTLGYAGEVTWYAVTNTVSISGSLRFIDDCARIIVADGATLAAINPDGDAVYAKKDLVVYGQAAGTGKLVAIGGDNGVYVEEGLGINHVIVNATGDDEYGIYSWGWAIGDGEAVINGATVTAEGGECGFFTYDGLIINGGSLTASGEIGIHTDYTLTINDGSIDANGEKHGIECDERFVANGGSVNAVGDGDSGISTYNGIIVNDGTIVAEGGKNGLYVEFSLDVYGGSVNATGGNCGVYAEAYDITVFGGNTSFIATREGRHGICAEEGDIILGWTNPTDSITLNGCYSEDGDISVMEGQLLTDGTNIYRGEIDLDDTASKTLRPYITPWASLQAQLDAGGTVMLTNDVTATDYDSYLMVTNAVTLDLNGHVLDAKGRFCAITIYSGGDLTLTNSVEGAGVITGGYDEAGGGVCVAGGGVFTMAGGVIAGNEAGSGGGVYVDRNSTFTMTGGEISGNTAVGGGGGVYMDRNSTFTMTGGRISGNTADDGGGVYVDGTFTVSGSPVVFGNTNAVGVAKNVCLEYGYAIAVSNLTAGASIGVATAAAPSGSSPVTFATGAAEGDEDYFFSDNSSYDVERDGSALLLVAKIFKDPQGNIIEDYAVVEWLSGNGFTQADIDGLGSDSAATDRLYECWLLNLNFTVQDAGATLSFTDITVSNRVSMTVQLVRKAPLAGWINGTLLIYGANDLAAGFDRDPIPDESVEYFTGDPSFNLVTASNDTVTQTAVATLNSSVTAKFFKAEIGIFTPYEPEDPWEPEPEDPEPEEPEE